MAWEPIPLAEQWAYIWHIARSPLAVAIYAIFGVLAAVLWRVNHPKNTRPRRKEGLR